MTTMVALGYRGIMTEGTQSISAQRPSREPAAMKQISKEWWIGIDETYRTRVDDGSLVIWRPERTIWINIWKDSDGRTGQERLDGWIADRHAGATDLFEHEDAGLLRFGYLLEEPEEGGGDLFGLYSYTVGESSTVQMACYFDLREDLTWATAVSQSLSFGRPDVRLRVEERIGKHGHLVLASEKVIGANGDPVLFAFREPGANQQDSGWRFFHGDEDEAFTADPANMALCPLSSLLGIDSSLRIIINSPAGTAWRRVDQAEPWGPAADHQEDRPEWE
jgi:hypothetical protein